MKRYDVIVVGGGAAGLFCAFTAGQRGKRVLVIEKSNKFGKKILMSGGGRCNFTNLNISADAYISHNPHFCKSALSQYTQWDFIALVEKHGVAYHEKTLGQLFCDDSSKLILNLLLDECNKVDVELHTDCEIDTVEKNIQFDLKTSHGNFSSPSLVVASGGLSIPSLGGSGFAYDLAEQFGLHVFPVQAALVPFVFTDQCKAMFARLSGVSLDVAVHCDHCNFREAMLFTHRGLSGPAILQCSSYWQAGKEITVSLVPDEDLESLLLEQKNNRSKLKLKNYLSDYLPMRLVVELEALWWQMFAARPLVEWPDQALIDVAKHLQSWRLVPGGTEGYRTAEVTLGGIDTDELSSKTMRCNKVPGLFFIGEAVDVTGHLGGYNFQWAWSSAYVAGQHV